MLRRWLPLGLTFLACVAGCGDDGDTSTGNNGSTGAPPPPKPSEIDLVVDANRDGVVNLDDPADQDREFEWDAASGASFIANLDDDDGNFIRDCDDDVINGDADFWDLANFQVRGWAEAPDDVKGHLFIDNESAENVRVFKLGVDGTWSIVLGSVGPCTSPADCTYLLDHVLTVDEARAGVTFAIEARRFKGMPMPSLVAFPGGTMKDKKNFWTGFTDFYYRIDKPDGSLVLTDEHPDGVDSIKMRVAPWMLLGSMNPHDALWMSKASAVFVAGNTSFAEAAGAPFIVPYATNPGTPGGWSDIWTEDFFQTGWTGFPGQDGAVRGMRIANARVFGRTNSDDDLPIRWILGNPAKGRAPAFLGPDQGGAAFYDPEHEQGGHTQDSHGAHDLIPPHEGYPLGRIITSNKILLETKEFYTAQSVQGPPIILDTTWLAVEHVDEFFHWVPAATPRGWKLLWASPALMLQMLEDLKAAGHGAAVLHKNKGGFFEQTVDEALSDPELGTWSQTAQVKIEGHIDMVKAETGLTDEEIIGIPTWFEDLGVGEKVAWNPGMVNMRMLGNRANVPKPFGPIIDGKDPFEEDLIARLGSPESQLGSDGQGLVISFTDDWYYHSALGEIHCGTNEAAPISAALGSWWESGK